jgi:tetratricopeptide (TPR) repeat protein
MVGLKRINLVLLLLVLPGVALSQAKTIDSLKKLLATNLPDTTRCNVLSELEEIADDDSWPVYANQLKEFSGSKRKLVPAGGKLYRFYSGHFAKSLASIGYIERSVGNYKRSIESFEEALEVAGTIDDRKLIQTVLNNIGTIYVSLGDTANALRKFRSSFRVAAGSNSYSGMTDALSNMAVVYSHSAQYAKSIYYSKQSIQYSEKIGDKKSTATTLSNMAQVYHGQGDVRSSIDCYDQSLKLFEELNDSSNIARLLNNVAVVYSTLGDTAKALEYHLRSLEIKEKTGDVSSTAYSLLNIADIYSVQGKNKAALEYGSRSLQLRESIHDNSGIAASLHSLAVVYFNLGDIDKAIDYYEKSIKIKEMLGDQAGISYSLSNLGALYYKKKQRARALQYLQRSLNIAKSIGNLRTIQAAAAQLNHIYKNEGKFKEALDYLELYLQLKDSMVNIETKKAVVRSQLQYEFEKKRLQAQASNEKKIAMVQLRSKEAAARKNLWIIVLLSLSIVVLTGSFFLYKFLRQKSVIANQKANILKQKLLVSQMNPHFIFNSLNAIQNYIFKQDSLKAGTYLSQFAELMRMILNYSRRDEIKLSEEIKLLENYFELQQLRFEFKFAYAIEVDEELEPSEVLIPPMLAQPFIENAIEHGIFYKEGKGHVYLRIYRKENGLVYEIEDDGVGLERSYELNKQKKAEHHSVATIITRERIDAMGQKGNAVSHIEITDLAKISPERSGVKVTFVIPYKQT